MFNLLGVYQICNGSRENLIENLVQWGLILASGTYFCPKCQAPLRLYTDVSRADGWRWVCRAMVTVGNRKRRQCGTKVEFRKESPNNSAKKASTVITHPRFIGNDNHVVQELIQSPVKHPKPEADYKCHTCDFRSSRIGVIVLHHKSHMQGAVLSPRKPKKTPTKKPPKSQRISFSKTSTIDEDIALLSKGVHVYSDSSTTDESDVEDEEEEEIPVKRKRKLKMKSPVKKKAKATPPALPEKPKDIRKDLLAEWDDDEDEEELEKEKQELQQGKEENEERKVQEGEGKIKEKEDNTHEKEDKLQEKEDKLQEKEDKIQGKEDKTQEKEDEIQKKEVLENKESQNKQEVEGKLEEVKPQPEKPQKQETVKDSIKEFRSKETSPQDNKPKSDSCFDFNEEEEELGMTVEGRKIPRVIPLVEKRKSLEDEEDQLNSEEKEKLMKDLQAINSVLEECTVPVLPELPSLKPRTSSVDSQLSMDQDVEKMIVATKLTNPKKRFAKTFEDETKNSTKAKPEEKEEAKEKITKESSQKELIDVEGKSFYFEGKTFDFEEKSFEFKEKSLDFGAKTFDFGAKSPDFGGKSIDVKGKSLDLEEKSPRKPGSSSLVNEEKLDIIEERFEAADENLAASEENLETSGEKLKFTRGKLKTTERQLKTTEKQLKATEKQLKTPEKQLNMTEEQSPGNKLKFEEKVQSEENLKSSEGKLKSEGNSKSSGERLKFEEKLKPSEENLKPSEEKLKSSEEKLKSSEEHLGASKEQSEAEEKSQAIKEHLKPSDRKLRSTEEKLKSFGEKFKSEEKSKTTKEQPEAEEKSQTSKEHLKPSARKLRSTEEKLKPFGEKLKCEEILRAPKEQSEAEEKLKATEERPEAEEKSQTSKDHLKPSDRKLRSTEEKLKPFGEKLKFDEKLRAPKEQSEAEEKSQATKQQLKPSDRKLRSTDEKLKHAEEKLKTPGKKSKAAEEQSKSNREKLKAIEEQLGSTGEELRDIEDQSKYSIEKLKGNEEESKLSEEKVKVTEEESKDIEEQMKLSREKLKASEDNSKHMVESFQEGFDSTPVKQSKTFGEKLKPTEEQLKPTVEQYSGENLKSAVEHSKSIRGKRSKSTGEKSKSAGEKSKAIKEQSKGSGEKSKPTKEKSKATEEQSKKSTGDKSKATGEEWKAIEEQLEHAGEKSKPTTEISELGGEKSKPTEEIPNPSGEILNLTGEKTKTIEEELNPSKVEVIEGSPKFVGERLRSTREKTKTAKEKLKIAEEKLKPTEEELKPSKVEEIGGSPKFVGERLRSTREKTKTVKEKLKIAEEKLKPTEEELKPSKVEVIEGSPKFVGERLRSTREKTKTAKEKLKIAEEKLKPTEEELKLTSTEVKLKPTEEKSSPTEKNMKPAGEKRKSTGEISKLAGEKSITIEEELKSSRARLEETEGSPKSMGERLRSSTREKMKTVKEKLKTTEEKLNPPEEKLKPTEEKSKSTEEIVKPTEEKSKPTEEKMKSSGEKLITNEEKTKTMDEELKPSREKLEETEGSPKPMGERLRSSTREKMKTVKEKLKPMGKETKLIEERLKPTEEKLKPTEEKLKPTEEKSKSAEEKMKPTQEILKPSEEILKPTVEILKPAEEKLKPIQEKVKATEEKLIAIEDIMTTTEEELKTTDEKSKTTEEKSKTTEEKSKTTEEKSKITEEKSKTTEEKSKTTEEKSKISKEKSKSSEEKLTTAQEKLKTTQEKLKTTQEKPKTSKEKWRTIEELKTKEQLKISCEQLKTTEEQSKTTEEEKKATEEMKSSVSNISTEIGPKVNLEVSKLKTQLMQKLNEGQVLEERPVRKRRKRSYLRYSNSESEEDFNEPEETAEVRKSVYLAKKKRKNSTGKPEEKDVSTTSFIASGVDEENFEESKSNRSSSNSGLTNRETNQEIIGGANLKSSVESSIEEKQEKAESTEVNVQEAIPETTVTAAGSSTKSSLIEAFASSLGTTPVDVVPLKELDKDEKTIIPESDLVDIEGNLTVVSEKDLADKQVEITATPELQKPVTLTSFSMDFCEDLPPMGSMPKCLETSMDDKEETPMDDKEETPMEIDAPKEEVSEKDETISKRESGSFVEERIEPEDDLPHSSIIEGRSLDVKMDEKNKENDKEMTNVQKPEQTLPEEGKVEAEFDVERFLNEDKIGETPPDMSEAIQRQVEEFGKEIVREGTVREEASNPAKLFEILMSDKPKSGQKLSSKTDEAKTTLSVTKSTVVKPIVSKETKPMSKSFVISDKVIRPMSESDSVHVKKVTKRSYQDIEDIDTFIIQKPIKKLVTEEVRKQQERTSPVIKPALKGKPRILQQTIITPSGDIIQPAVTQSQDDLYDINSMPIVLGDQILTPENIETVPVVLQQDNIKQISSIKKTVSTTVTTTTPTSQIKLLNKSLPSSSTKEVSTKLTPIASKSYVSGRQKFQKVYQTSSTKLLKPSIISQHGKPGKFIIVPSTSSQPTGSKYTVGKRPAIVKKPPPQKIQLPTSNVPQTTTGNKIMILTDSQGQQQKVLLTPAQQKHFIGPKKRIIQKQIMSKDAHGKNTANIISQTIVTSKGQMTTLGTTSSGNLLCASSTNLMGSSTSLMSSSTNVMGSSTNLLTSSSTNLMGTSSTNLLGTSSTNLLGTSSANSPVIQQAVSKNIKIEPKLKRPIQQKFFSDSSTLKAGPSGQQRTIIIKNPQGQTVKKMQGADDSLLDQQVAEQIQAINRAAAKNRLIKEAGLLKGTARPPVKKSYVKKEVKSSAIQKQPVQNVPPLAPISPIKKTEPLPKAEEKQQESKKPQFVIRDGNGALININEGQILALPSEAVDGQPQSYVLVTIDEAGNLTPLNSEALMSLDPNLNLGGDLSNTVLQIEQGVQQEGEVQLQVMQEGPQEQSVVAEVQKELEKEVQEPIRATTSEAQQTNVQAVVNAGDMGQLIITGDPVSAQKFLDSLAEGNTDLANLLANTEGNVLIQADGQQILINTDADNSLLSVNQDNVENTEGSGNPVFSGQAISNKNQDILAAALADTDVFQQDQSSIGHSPSKVVTQSQLSPNSGLFPINVGNVLETNTMSSPIMTPLEVPSTNNKKIGDENDILNQDPKNVVLPITITDPSISQTAAQHQVASLIGSDLQTNLDLPLAIQDPGILVTSSGMNSPSFVYSLPTLDDTDINQKSFNSSISMPLLTEEPEEIPSTSTEVVTETIIDTSAKEKSEIDKIFCKDPKGDIKSITNEENIQKDTAGSEKTETYSMRPEMCNSLSEPPPDMFEFTIDSERPTPETDSTSGSMLSNSDNTDIDRIVCSDSGAEDKLEQDKNSPSSSSDYSCEIPVQPRIIANLSNKPFEENGTVDEQNFSGDGEI